MKSSKKRAFPSHVGIIMDGNGRWAVTRKKPRTFGHREGLNTAKRIVKHASYLQIPYITLYAFSTENWKRTKDEVGFLMDLIRLHLKKEMQFYIDNQIRVVHTGNPHGLSKAILNEIQTVVNATSGFTGTTVNLAINYGGRDEIVRSVQRIVEAGVINELSETLISAYLDQHGFPDPDLIIRTGGDCRLSNFLLWQSAYSEIFISDKFWPDWTEADLDAALDSYCGRVRKFGGVL
ncbi:MAG: di-trans,poly-cis-decaprenylcistransferase [Spirochaetales bacterium]|nr:di-trans,poly-cis-decaprenylcistransferase [Spirochaetales bacterium]